MNPWLLSIVPGNAPKALYDREISKPLIGHTGDYFDLSSCVCKKCSQRIGPENSELIGRRWVHLDCQADLIIPWADEPTIETVLYHYHEDHCARLDMIDDLHKLRVAGKQVVIDAHDYYGLPEIAKEATALIVHRPDQINVISDKPTKFIPYLCPNLFGSDQIPWSTNTKITIGWHGQWYPHKQVHQLIQIVAKAREQVDIGLIAQGAIGKIGNTTAISSTAYFAYCQELVRKLDLEKHVYLSSDTLSFIEIGARLKSCDLFVLPHETTHGRALLVCAGFGAPILTYASKIAYLDEHVKAIEDDLLTELLAFVNSSDLVNYADLAKELAISSRYSIISGQYLDFMRELKE